MPSPYIPANSPVYRQGSTGMPQSPSAQLAAIAAQNATMDYDEDSMRWAAVYRNIIGKKVFNTYYDYYFSGQDIKVSIEGIENEDIPIIQFAWSVTQNKQPLYGYWDYTYAHLMKGTRIVQGAYSIVTKNPSYMTQIVAAAATARVAKHGQLSSIGGLRNLDEDETLMEKYWANPYDANLVAGEESLWSSHPPFNFLIKYGIQSTSITDFDNDSARVNELLGKFYEDQALYTDTNERLVDADPNEATMRLYLERVELTGVQQEFNPSGDPIGETYSFIARDVRPSPVISRPSDTSSSPVGGPIRAV